MSDTDFWLKRYEQNQQDLDLRPLYWLATGLLVLGLIGLLWALPVPQALTTISPLLNWGSLFLMAAFIYYFIISVPLAIGMLPVIVAIFAFEFWLFSTERWAQPGVVVMTLAGLAGLYVAHRAHGGYRAVFRDVQLLMIAPLWLLSRLYRKLGIPS
ncbi:MAG: hypothetical protein HKN35_02640 [Woeseia sp.]|nr:hypothetical protein [Woeseia sp.]MBT8097245.1 hypothetical protein [Woeseia sp.]NNE59772.1 hypothetical protein [Woeseia sp.]NNL54669.1 hypothetical protein [Woeseia sp.]